MIGRSGATGTSILLLPSVGTLGRRDASESSVFDRYRWEPIHTKAYLVHHRQDSLCSVSASGCTQTAPTHPALSHSRSLHPDNDPDEGVGMREYAHCARMCAYPYMHGRLLPFMGPRTCVLTTFKCSSHTHTHVQNLTGVGYRITGSLCHIVM